MTQENSNSTLLPLALSNMKIETLVQEEIGSHNASSHEIKQNYCENMNTERVVLGYLDGQGIGLQQLSQEGALRGVSEEGMQEKLSFVVALINQILIHGPNTAESPVPPTLELGTGWPVNDPNYPLKNHVHALLKARSLDFSMVGAISEMDRPDVDMHIRFLASFVTTMVNQSVGIPGLGASPVVPGLM